MHVINCQTVSCEFSWGFATVNCAFLLRRLLKISELVLPCRICLRTSLHILSLLKIKTRLCCKCEVDGYVSFGLTQKCLHQQQCASWIEMDTLCRRNRVSRCKTVSTVSDFLPMILAEPSDNSSSTKRNMHSKLLPKKKLSSTRLPFMHAEHKNVTQCLA